MAAASGAQKNFEYMELSAATRSSSPLTGSAAGTGRGASFIWAARASKSSAGSSGSSAQTAGRRLHQCRKRLNDRSKLTFCSRCAWNGRFSQTSPSTGESNTSAPVRPGKSVV